VIRVYDAAGNVIETHEHKAIWKTGQIPPDLLEIDETQQPIARRSLDAG